MALKNNEIEEESKGNVICIITNDGKVSSNNVRAIIAGNVPIPAGTTYIEGTVDTGVVIEIDEDKSQFVWVPVLDITNMAIETSGTDSNGRKNYQGKL